jgi:hypothetical protein
MGCDDAPCLERLWEVWPVEVSERGGKNKAKMLRLERLWVREERGKHINRHLNWSPGTGSTAPQTGSTGIVQCGQVTRFGQENKEKNLTHLQKGDWRDIN